MPRSSNENSSTQCPFCPFFLEKGKHHDEFDFYNHPDKKKEILELQKKLHDLGRPRFSTSFSWTDEYAEKRNPPIKSSHGVVMPAYGRLLNAYNWLIKLEEQERKDSLKVVEGMEPGPVQGIDKTSLPF